METQPLVNRVAESGLKTINLEDYYPEKSITVFDLKDFLFQGLILREKEFRQALQQHDWSAYRDKIVLVQCTADAIIPLWAYMLVATYLTELAIDVYHGTIDDYLTSYYKQIIEKMDRDAFVDERIVIKGCSARPVPAQAYATLTRHLKPVAKSILFGEPCSTVPIYKKPK